MFVRAYLRASTDEQDAARARDQLQAFATERGLKVAAWYVENESGAKLARPELFRLLADAQPGDVLMIEQVDRLSRLTAADWEKLKAELTSRRVRVVALDLPTTWTMANAANDEFTARMFEAINGIAARHARRHCQEGLRRSPTPATARPGQGRGPLQGRKEDVDRNDGIADMLANKVSWTTIQKATGCSRATIAKIAKRGAGEARA
jgi:DNA invertase Pin-like site-specific DNA recombinase